MEIYCNKLNRNCFEFLVINSSNITYYTVKIKIRLVLRFLFALKKYVIIGILFVYINKYYN